MESYAWPGNIRELENVIERAALAAAHLKPGETISSEHLRAIIPELFARGEAVKADTRALLPNMKSVTRSAESAHIRSALEECGGNVAEASRRLGVSRSTLWRRLKAGVA
jgi:propionate catabolism operon transcriptional regulator